MEFQDSSPIETLSMQNHWNQVTQNAQKLNKLEEEAIGPRSENYWDQNV